MSKEEIEELFQEIGSNFKSFRVFLALCESIDLFCQRIDLRKLNLRIFFSKLLEKLYYLTQVDLCELPNAIYSFSLA